MVWQSSGMPGRGSVPIVWAYEPLTDWSCHGFSPTACQMSLTVPTWRLWLVCPALTPPICIACKLWMRHSVVNVNWCMLVHYWIIYTLFSFLLYRNWMWNFTVVMMHFCNIAARSSSWVTFMEMQQMKMQELFRGGEGDLFMQWEWCHPAS